VLDIDVWSPNGDVYLGIKTSDGKELLATSAKAVAGRALPPAAGLTFTLTAAGGNDQFFDRHCCFNAGATTTPAPTSASQATGTQSQPVVLSYRPFDLRYGPKHEGSYEWWKPYRRMASDGKLPNTSSMKMTLDDAKVYVTGKGLIGLPGGSRNRSENVYGDNGRDR
jgi:hypothetical protein